MLGSGLQGRMVAVGLLSGALGALIMALLGARELTLIGVTLAGIAGSGIAYVAGVRPTARNIARVTHVATRLGTETGFTPIETDARDLIGGLALELDRAHARIRTDAEQLERSRNDLEMHLADVAHDLRTPVTSLQLALERATSMIDRPTELAEVLTGAVNDVIYLGGLTANLRLARQLEQRWSLAPDVRTSLNDTVDRAVARVRFLAQLKGMGLDHALPDELVEVACDPIALEQAVGNVVENAVTHGGEDGHVAVMLRVSAPGRFEIVVVDDGPGVTQEELPQLGARTFRTDAARQRDARGSGLGLAITRTVCERSGFELGFSNETPRGLRVTISGPVSSVGPRVRAEPAADA